MGVFRTISLAVLLRGAAALCLLGVVCAQNQAFAAVPPPGALIVNTVTADFSDKSGAAMPQQIGTATVPATGPPSLSVTVSDSPDPVLAGEYITYTITVTNDGYTPLTGVELTNPIPAKTGIISADSGGILSSKKVKWSIGGLGVGESVTVHLVVNVDKDAPDGLVITDTAVADSKETKAASDTETTTVIARTQGVVVFTDASGSPVSAYAVGGTVYVMVTDADQDSDPASPDTVGVVIVSHRSGPDGSVLDTIAITLTETGNNTGVFTGFVVTTAAPADPADGLLSVEPDSTLIVTYTDPLDPQPAVDDSAFIDPFGVVFDSVDGTPVAGAIVTLIDEFTGAAAVLPQPPAVPVAQANPVVTGADGVFQFRYVNPGTYHLLVEPGGSYFFPSGVKTKDLPPGYTIGAGSRGESFTLAAGMGALNIDVPVDPPGGSLDIEKSADRGTASVGDAVVYRIIVTDNGIGPVVDLVVTDKMPHGVHYVNGSTTVDGAKGPDPEVTGKNVLVWNIGSVPPGGSLELTYSAVVGPDAVKGGGINTAHAAGTSAGEPVASGRAVHRLEISEGVFTSRGTVIGKVFSDGNSDGVQQPGEAGLPGIVLYMEDGTSVVTDPDGKYSIYGVLPGTHVVKLDTATLPEGASPATVSSRFAGDTDSQFVDMVPGLMHKANFAVHGYAGKPETEKPEQASAAGAAGVPGKPVEADKPPAPSGDQPGTPSGGAAGGPVQPEGELPDPYEENIRDMTPELAILEPADGLVHVRDSIDVAVKAHNEASVSLTVNGEEVGPERIGKKMELASTKVIIYRYIAVPLKPGENNVIRAEMKDPFGNVRGAKEITVVAPGGPSGIEVSPDGPEAPADGLTETVLSVRAVDGNGNMVTSYGSMTVTVTAGEILNEDTDKTTPGVQLRPEMGVVEVRLRSPKTAGEARLFVGCGGVERTVDVYFYPHLRDIMAVGVGEAVMGYGTTKGSDGYLEHDGWFKKGLYAGGRGAFFMKGGIGRGVLLTMAYDSEKDEEDVGLFHEKTGNVESEELYPIYGDESRQSYEANSTDEFYVRLDRGRSHLLYGDYRTELDATRLSALRRSFNGIETELNEGMVKLKGFASRTERFQAVDTFQGRGIAGYYFLENSPVVDGSELVVIETRDRLKPDRVISREKAARWSDYSIDYGLGAVLFKEPVPSRDIDLNPVYIIVSYESEGAQRHYVYGGRAAVRPVEIFEAGFTGIVEESGLSDYMLLGVDTTLKLPFNSVLKAEWAQSDSVFTENSVFTPKTDRSWLARLESTPVKGLKLAAGYYDYGGFFKNDSAVDVRRGTKGYELEFGYELGADTRARGRFIKEEDTLNKTRYLHASAGVQTKLGKTVLGVEAVHERSKDRFIPMSSPSTRFPFDISERTADRTTSLKFLFATPIWKDILTFSAEHSQDVMHNRNNMTQAGIDYKYSEDTRLYVREQYATYDDHGQLRTVAGVESNVTANTVAFSEYRLSGGAPGYRNQHAIGLRNKFALGKGITGNFAVENLSTLSGPDMLNEPDAFAVSLGMEYLPTDELKASTRLEYRDSSMDVSKLAEAGLTYKLDRDLSMFARGRYFDVSGSGSGKRSNSGAVLGLAYRPVGFDEFNALAKAEYRHETRIGTPDGRSSDTFIMSAEANYQVHAGAQLTGKYACKYVSFGPVGSYTDLISARLLYDITDKFDMGITYRMLTTHLTGSRLQGGSAELGYNVFKNIWLSAGYSFDGFDADLTGDDYQGHGPYVKIRAKFTEGLFK